jgi:predicted RNA-binding Zn ribbon-like protein
MSGAWTKRQFVGGTVALDFANTVCYRDDPGRCFDKISGPAELAGFAEAALQLSDAGGWDATAPSPDIDGIGFSLYLELREAADALLRPVRPSGRCCGCIRLCCWASPCGPEGTESSRIRPDGRALH